MHPSENTSEYHDEDEQDIVEPQSDVNLIYRSIRLRHAPARLCLYVDAKEHELGDHNEPINYKATFLDPESKKWIEAINVEMQSMKDNQQASRQCNKRFDEEIKKFSFAQNHDEPCVYVKASGSMVTFLILYVDDMLITKNHILMLQDVKCYLGKCFSMKDLGKAAYILGIKIYRVRSRRLNSLCQSAYIEKILKRFNMENSKRRSIPMQEKPILGKAEEASTPTEVKCVHRVPYASLCDLLCVVDWKSAKQSTIATSSTEAKYMAALEALKEAV
nr:retrotransposon protein, putative, Ty1-copia subclass [Tanacetum cinerariifolium]